MPSASNVLGAVTVALAVAGSNAKVFESHAKCTVHALASTEKQLGEQTAQAVNDAMAYICDDKFKKDAPEIARHTAEAYVKATADVILNCHVTGAGSVDVSGYAKAVAKGKAWLSAYADAWAQADSCVQTSPWHDDYKKECAAVANAYLHIQEQVFLKTVAEQKDAINAMFDKRNTGQKLNGEDEAKLETLMRATAEASAKALAVAGRDAKNEGCAAFVEVSGEIKTGEKEKNGQIIKDGEVSNSATCTSFAAGITKNQMVNAYAEAAKTASDLQCKTGHIDEKDAEEIMSDIAKATAEVWAVSYSGCKTTGDDKKHICAYGEIDIETFAYASAEAFAEAWAGANAGNKHCECQVGGDAVISSMGGILVDAITWTYSFVCPSKAVKTYHDDDLNWNWDKNTQFAKALAKAVVEVADNGQNDNRAKYDDGETCAIKFEVETSVCECKPRYQKCVDGDRVLGCCDKDTACIASSGSKWHKAAARCKPMSSMKRRPSQVILPQTCGAAKATSEDP